MPRRKKGTEEQGRFPHGDLAARLADELRSNRESGQPVIYEQEFPSGQMSVTVVWDAWDHLPLEDRTSVILRAYELAEEPGSHDRIALASGLSVPEAYSAGFLPYEIIPALRRGDSVTLAQCRQAMKEEGASTLLGLEKPLLRFATEEEAEAARKRLVQRLPNSDEVWVITQEVGKIEDWAQR